MSRRLNINLMLKSLLNKRHKGEIGTMTAIFMILFVLIIIVFEMQVDLYTHTSTMVEDSLSSSNLAAAVIDIETYGINHDIIIKSPDDSFVLWQECFKTNLGLDDNWCSDNTGAISGKVEIIDYIVYNVRGSDIYIYRYGQSPGYQMIPGGLGSVKAPNGTIIESTSIYSKVTFPIKGAFGIETTGMKDELVDIVRN